MVAAAAGEDTIAPPRAASAATLRRILFVDMANNPFGSQGFYRNGAVSAEFARGLMVPKILQQVEETLVERCNKFANGYGKA
jgi:hypothetical protein